MVLLIGWLVAAGAVAQEGVPAEGTVSGAADGGLGGAGVVWVETGGDATGAPPWVDGGAGIGRCLSWPHGLLLVPDGCEVLAGPDGSVGVRWDARLRGFTEGRHLLLTPGRYAILAPLMLTDGTWHLFLSGGELEMAPGRISCRAGPGNDRERMARVVMLLGIVLVVVMLTVRNRAALRRR